MPIFRYLCTHANLIIGVRIKIVCKNSPKMLEKKRRIEIHLCFDLSDRTLVSNYQGGAHSCGLDSRMYRPVQII